MIAAFGTLRHGDHKFKSRLRFTVRPCLKNKYGLGIEPIGRVLAGHAQALTSILGTQKLGVGAQDCCPITWEGKAVGSKVQGYPQLHSESEVSLSYMEPCPKE